MNLIQLEFFKTAEECEMEAMRKEIAGCLLSSEKVRKKLFAENGKLTKEVIDLKERLSHLERFVCHLKAQSQS